MPYRLGSLVGIAAVAAAIFLAVPARGALMVDFGPSTGDVQSGWEQYAVTQNAATQTETYNNPYGLSGTVDVTLTATAPATLDYRDRGNGPSVALNDILEDFATDSENDSDPTHPLVLTLAELKAGNYTIITYHDDESGMPQPMDIDIIDTDSTRTRTRLDVIVSQDPQTETEVGKATFDVVVGATGQFEMRFYGVTQPRLNGFSLSSVPEPTTAMLVLMGFGGVLIFGRGRHRLSTL